MHLMERFWSKVDIKSDNECWPWTAAVRNKKEGYGAFWYHGRHHPAQRIALFLSTGVLETILEVCHKCDNPGCCNPSHLFTGTHKENNDDKVAKKRHAFGERCGTSLLTEKQVLEIRDLKGEMTQVKIGEIYGVRGDTVCDIQRRKSWRHI